MCKVHNVGLRYIKIIKDLEGQKKLRLWNTASWSSFSYTLQGPYLHECAELGETF